MLTVLRSPSFDYLPRSIVSLDGKGERKDVRALVHHLEDTIHSLLLLIFTHSTFDLVHQLISAQDDRLLKVQLHHLKKADVIFFGFVRNAKLARH